MSLINEALKKAQRQRVEAPVDISLPNAAPSLGGGAPRIAKRKEPMSARTQMLLLGGGGLLLLMSGVSAFLLLTEEASPPTPVKPPVVARPVDTTPATPPATDVPVAGNAPVGTPVPVIAPLNPAQQTIASVTLPIIETPQTPVAAAPAILAPTPNPKVYEFLETLKITGIRVSETDPKVIMNDRVFRLNDLVDRGTQLRLIRVDSSSLTFVDATGFEYVKSF